MRRDRTGEVIEDQDGDEHECRRGWLDRTILPARPCPTCRALACGQVRAATDRNGDRRLRGASLRPRHQHDVRAAAAAEPAASAADAVTSSSS